MAKLVFSILMIVVWWMLQALQLDEELALSSVHEAKRAVNRAAHAAAQQLDRDKLEMGVLSIHSGEAEAAALAYLSANLRLDGDLFPVSGSVFRERVIVEDFSVINEEESFPYTYRNSAFGYESTLSRPGVVLIVHVQFPRLFGVLSPVEWDLKGTAELVYS